MFPFTISPEMTAFSGDSEWGLHGHLLKSSQRYERKSLSAFIYFNSPKNKLKQLGMKLVVLYQEFSKNDWQSE